MAKKKEFKEVYTPIELVQKGDTNTYTYTYKEREVK